MTASHFLVKGQKTELRCSASGLPTPNVMWTRLGVELIEGRRFAVLSLNNVTKADQGIYRCTANNSQGQKSATMNLTVVGRWLKSFKTLVCKETVVPRRWGRETLKFDDKELMIEVTEYEAYLCIASFSLRFRSDKGLTHERLLVFGNSTLIINSFDIKFAWLKFFVRQLSKTCKLVFRVLKPVEWLVHNLGRQCVISAHSPSTSYVLGEKIKKEVVHKVVYLLSSLQRICWFSYVSFKLCETIRRLIVHLIRETFKVSSMKAVLVVKISAFSSVSLSPLV